MRRSPWGVRVRLKLVAKQQKRRHPLPLSAGGQKLEIRVSAAWLPPRALGKHLSQAPLLGLRMDLPSACVCAHTSLLYGRQVGAQPTLTTSH